jgi:hypothetical protein
MDDEPGRWFPAISSPGRSRLARELLRPAALRPIPNAFGSIASDAIIPAFPPASRNQQGNRGGTRRASTRREGPGKSQRRGSDKNLRDKPQNCGRICLGRKKINFSTVFAGQAVGIKEVHDDIWLVSFMDYDLGCFDLETHVLEPLDNPFGPGLLPM